MSLFATLTVLCGAASVNKSPRLPLLIPHIIVAGIAFLTAMHAEVERDVVNARRSQRPERQRWKEEDKPKLIFVSDV